jgi:hypothetical protein
MGKCQAALKKLRRSGGVIGAETQWLERIEWNLVLEWVLKKKNMMGFRKWAGE